MSRQQQEQQGTVQAWHELRDEILASGELCGCLNWACWNSDELDANLCAECGQPIRPLTWEESQ